MNKEEFRKMWKKWLIDVGVSETQLAHELGRAQQNLNRSINNASIKYVELSEIIERYGYTVEIRKKD